MARVIAKLVVGFVVLGWRCDGVAGTIAAEIDAVEKHVLKIQQLAQGDPRAG